MSTAIRQFTCKAPADAVELYNELYDQARQTRPALTRGAFLEEIVHAYANPRTVEKEVEKIVERPVPDPAAEAALAAAEADRDEARANLAAAADQCAGLEDQLATLQAEAEALRRDNDLLRHAADDPAAVTLRVPQPHRALLEATCQRLAATPSDVLLDMFFRYTVEQRAEWFYPFVITDPDIKHITGHTRQTLAKWIQSNRRRQRQAAPATA